MYLAVAGIVGYLLLLGRGNQLPTGRAEYLSRVARLYASQSHFLHACFV